LAPSRVAPTLSGVFALLALLVLGAATAQKPKPPEVCPYCKNDPVLMQRAGVVSHGPIAIGPKGSDAILAKLPTSQWTFLETAHIRWASSLGTCNVDMEDKKRVYPKLDRLRELLPDVPKEPKKLDPFLRLHVFALEGEDFYARFQKLLRVTDADFPEERRLDRPFMGAGRFLGEKDKFEIVIHASRSTHALFTSEFAGATVPDALRWHFKEQHKMLISIPAEDSDLRQDRWLFPHVVHGLAHLCLSAYKHFSYDPPLWIDEGIALAMEKEIEPESTTNEGEEGGKTDERGPRDWVAATKKMIAAGKQERVATMWGIKEVAELKLHQKLTCWSMARFLIDEHGDRFAEFLAGVKGQLDEQQQPTGRDLPSLQRKLLRELWGWSPAELDAAWLEWVNR
jgi:hypothetical protein